MFNYCEIVKNGIQNRGQIYKVNNNLTFDGSSYNYTDTYHSVFMHTTDFQSYDDGRGGKTGYQGEVDINYLYWDFDSSDLEISYAEACKLVERLLENGVMRDSIIVYFSGGKGFHVVLATDLISDLVRDKTRTNLVVKNVCSKLAENLRTFDSRIYDKTRIIRTPNTKHSKTGLYKIPVDDSDSVADVLEKAKSKQPTARLFESLVLDESDFLRSLIIEGISNAEKEDTSAKKQSANSVLNGILNGFDEGERNNGLTSFVGMLHKRNFSPDYIMALATMVNNNSKHPLGIEAVQRIVNSIGRYPVDQEYVEPKINDILTMEQASEVWLDLRSRNKYIDTGFVHLNREIPLFDPGQVFSIAARAGVGKTTWAMQIGSTMAASVDGYSLFASLEMPAPSVFLRAATIEAASKRPCTTPEVANMLLSEYELKQQTINNWNSLLTIDKDSLSLEQIETYFHLAQDHYNNRIDNLIIDYGGLIKGANDYSSISRIAREIKALAKRLKTKIILVLQLSREGGDGTLEVKMHHMRDSGAWEEASDYIAGVWISSEDTKRLHVSMLKNRFGERGGRFDMIVNGLRYKSTEFQQDKRKGF